MMMTKILLGIGCWLLAVASIAAQTGARNESIGELRLQVNDPSGRALAASGRLVRLPDGAAREFQTDAMGGYTFRGLPVGRYQLTVARNGFAAQSLEVELDASAPVARAVTLAVSELAFAVEVVAATPLPGVERAPEEVAAPVQAATARDVAQSGALDLADFLNRRLSGVHLNEVQNNPFQPDVNYRGYTASPLLGTPQGLSVYLDGVRLNQPFGDVVSWDVIPRIAIAEVALMPGSNPLFGLNTLGGALALQTKDGRNHAGTALQISGGSFGRATADLEHGGANSKGLSWYLGSTLFFEDGWRDNSPSNVRQFFGKLTWARAQTSLGLTVTYASNLLSGSGLQEQRFLDRAYRSVYTKPDVTGTRAPLFNLTAQHSFAARLQLSGNAYYRYLQTGAFNGDINEDALDQSIYQPSAAERAALAAAGYTGFPASGATAANTPFPFWRCLGQVLLRDEPAEKCTGLLNRTQTQQHNFGAAGQLTWLALSHAARNRFTAGAAYDGNRVRFSQRSQLGYLNPDRSITGVNAFGDGVTGGTVDGAPYDTRVDLRGRITTGSLFAVDTISLGDRLHVTLSGRYNRTTIDNQDRIRPVVGTGSLTGKHSFGRFNPAVGVTFNPWRRLNAYASYTQGSRAPTAIELGCADPATPCKLPNALAGDPPLQQVITRTGEAGVRGGIEGKWRWSAGWFRADNRRDILFVASSQLGQTGFGYFKNFGRTLRQGAQFDVNGGLRRLNVGSSYTWLAATFESAELVNGASNSASDAPTRGLEGAIQISPGAQMPLIPRHVFKAFADLRASARLSVDLNLVAISGALARGNENNLHEPDGQFYLGAGRSPGYAVTNLGARYQVTRRLHLFAQINNLFDRRYFTAAQLGVTGFTDAGAFIARPFAAVNGQFPLRHATFYAPGAPRGAWGGVRIEF